MGSRKEVQRTVTRILEQILKIGKKGHAKQWLIFPKIRAYLSIDETATLQGGALYDYNNKKGKGRKDLYAIFSRYKVETDHRTN